MITRGTPILGNLHMLIKLLQVLSWATFLVLYPAIKHGAAGEVPILGIHSLLLNCRELGFMIYNIYNKSDSKPTTIIIIPYHPYHITELIISL